MILTFFCSGSDVPKDAQNFKDELARITKYIEDLAEKVRKDCDAFSEVGLLLPDIDIIHPSSHTKQLFAICAGCQILGRVQDWHQRVLPMAGKR